MRHWVVLSATVMLAGGCQILSYTWVTPASVAPGSVFTMELTGSTNTILGAAGVVFQVPNGFTVLGASVVADVPLGVVTRDLPALLGIYTPDPGHYLASFSGATAGLTSGPFVRCRVYVQAPATPGSHQFEMALATWTQPGLPPPPTPWVPQLGLGSFQAPGGSIVRAIQVSGSPATPPLALTAASSDVTGLLDVEAADVHRDGRVDLLLLTVSGVTLKSSLPGGFAPGVVLPAGAGSLQDCVVADFDGDGFADVALSNGTVLFGDGGATWTPVTAFAGGGAAVAAGDVDGDGLADLAWSDAVALGLVRGQANRTFVPWSAGLPAAAPAAYPRGMTAADLDGDGRAELLVLAAVGPQWRVYGSTPAGLWTAVGPLSISGRLLPVDVDGNGTKELLHGSTGQLFAYAPTGLTAIGPSGVPPCSDAEAGDFDRDGDVDVATGNGGPFTIGPPRVQLWRNNGAGSFQPVALPPASGFDAWTGIQSLVAADFDDDTFPDLFAAADTWLLAWHNTERGVAPYGAACGPVGAAPALTVVGSILPGQSGALQLANAAPSGGTLLWLGGGRTLWNGQPVLPLDLGIVGAPGCTLLAEPLAIVGVVANGSGVASVPFTVPLFAPAAEVALFAQGAALAPGANALGAVFSRGLALKIQ